MYNSMARIARVVLPGYPHHIIQRGNRNQDVFFKEEDYLYYLELLKHWCKKESVKIWSYCLMTNHVHLVVTPKTSSNLAKAMGETHRRYTQRINQRENWHGYLWQGRFASYPMDKSYLLKASAYIELNPVKAGMVSAPDDYRWSSVHAHLTKKDPLGIINPKKMLAKCGGWGAYLDQAKEAKDDEFLKHGKTGRPLGNESFIKKAGLMLNRDFKKRKPGRKSLQ